MGEKLRDIEHGNYDVKAFMEEMKEMVAGVVQVVKNDHSARKIEVTEEQKKAAAEKDSAQKKESKSEASDDSKIACPRCGEGKMVKGKMPGDAPVSAKAAKHSSLLNI